MERDIPHRDSHSGEIAGVGVIGSLLLASAIVAFGGSRTPEECLPPYTHSLPENCTEIFQKQEDLANVGWVIGIGGPITILLGAMAYDELYQRKQSNKIISSRNDSTI